MSRSPPALLKPMRRFVEIAAQPQAAADRTLSFSFSSEAPVARWFGDEVLSHAPGAADLSRLNDGAALLFNHDPSDVIGVVESASIDTRTKRGMVTARFAATPRGDEILGMVREGILRNVSFMYSVDAYQDMGDDQYIATSWTPLEVSIVTIPADPSVGIGRALHTDTIREKFTMTPQNETLTRSQRRAFAAEQNEERSAVDLERARVAEIEAMCAHHDLPADMRRELVASGASVSESRTIALEHLQRRWNAQAQANFRPAPEGMMEYREPGQQYSLSRAILAAATGDWQRAGFERSVSQDLARKRGRDSAGLLVPTDVLAQRSDYSTLTGPAGGAIVATNLQAGAFIEVLRKRCRVLQLGATVLSGLVGNVDIPRRTAAGPAQWINEGEALTAGAGSFDVVSLRPKTVGSLSVLSRNLLLQGTPNAEMLVRADMVAQLAIAIDYAAINGSGVGAEPRGILNTTGVGLVDGGTNGAAVTIDHLIQLHAIVAAANADDGQLAFLSNPMVMAALSKLKTTTGAYLWSDRGGPAGENHAPVSAVPGATAAGDRGFSVLGFPVAFSGNVPSNLTKGTGTNLSAVLFGRWDDVVIGEWGVMEILPNPYASGVYEAGGIQLRAMQTIDVAVRHAESFAVMKDAITA